MKRTLAVITLMVCALSAFAQDNDKRTPASTAGPTAADLLFRDSDIAGARAKTARVLKWHSSDLDGLFVEMEAAALAADTQAELQAALRLCETRSADPRVTIAAARILDLAANTSQFRAVALRVRALARAKSVQANHFRSALLAAAADGLRLDSPRDLAQQAGLVTDWRIAGPFGRFGNVDFDHAWPPERDGLTGTGSPRAEAFRYDDGNVSLPEYFARAGVYYAEGQITTAADGEFIVRAETVGTLLVAVDGKIVLLKDDRFRASPAIAASKTRLAAGNHHVLVKFLPAASPFRIAVFRAEEVTTPRAAAEIAPDAERDYVTASLMYWSGDYAGAIARLKGAANQSAAAQFLLAQAWARDTDPDAPDVVSLLNATLTASPQALAAEMVLAANAYSSERVDEALERVRRVLAARPDFLPAQELFSELAIHLKWQSDASQAMEARVRMHPNCSTLRDALKFFSGSAQFQRAAEIEQRLNECSPASLWYIEALRDAGKHREAASAAAAKVIERPLDRDARYALVRELRLAGDFVAAAKAAGELAVLAPNSERFRRLAEQTAKDPSAQFEDDDGRGSGFGTGDSFYQSYRRDATEILARTNDRRFSGGPAVILLNDRVVRVAPDGSAAVYVHKITRLLTRDGIERYGEVSIPEGADLLELRTLKPDGSMVEPEFLEHKTTVSMPALAPGDAIEREYVLRYAPHAVVEHPEAFRFVFGSFEAPILFSRFAVLSAPGESAQVAASAGTPAPVVKDGGALRVWEKNDIAQSLEEIAMPRGDTLPNVRVLPLDSDDWQQVRDHYRNLAIEATRVDTRVAQAAEVHSQNPEAKARELYRLVTSRIRAGNTAFGENITPAEDTLTSGQGSRTATLLALARAAGIRADLVLARDVGVPEPRVASLDAYTRPLVRFAFDARQVFVDAEAEGTAFGVVPPVLERQRALMVPLETSGEPIFIALAGGGEKERSVAHSELTLDQQGDLAADLTITMGASRGAQMRSILRGIPASGRQHFFEQLAMRIFPAATEVRGEVHDEQDPDRPLVLHVTCRSPRFVSFSGPNTDMDQLAPALNLRKMYVGSGPRRFGLYIDTPLFESATFRLHLPAGVRLLHRADDLEERNAFGEYAVHFRELGPVVEVSRSFRIPPQVIAPGQYEEFARFATRIDDAERQRLTLERATAPVWSQ